MAFLQLVKSVPFYLASLVFIMDIKTTHMQNKKTGQKTFAKNKCINVWRLKWESYLKSIAERRFTMLV